MLILKNRKVKYFHRSGICLLCLVSQSFSGANLLFWCLSQAVPSAIHFFFLLAKQLRNFYKEQVQNTQVHNGGQKQPQPHCSECAEALSVVVGLGPHHSCVLRVDVARKWHDIKNKKQICLCPSRLPGIKRLSFQQQD